MTKYFVDASGAVLEHTSMLEVWESEQEFRAHFVDFANLIPFTAGYFSFKSFLEVRYFCFVFGFTKEWELEQ